MKQAVVRNKIEIELEPGLSIEIAWYDWVDKSLGLHIEDEDVKKRLSEIDEKDLEEYILSFKGSLTRCFVRGLLDIIL